MTERNDLMRYFTDSPYERLMQKKPEPPGRSADTRGSADRATPCKTCPYRNRNPCIAYCLRELMKGGK